MSKSEPMNQNKNTISIIEERELFGKTLRIYGTMGEPLFLAKEVAEWIDYAKTSQGYYDVSQMIKSVDDDEKVKIYCSLPTTNNLRSPVKSTEVASNKWFLTEDGLYEVLMLGRKELAKKFKKEVKKILKQIRKTGGYIPVKEEDSDLEIVSRAFLISQRTIEEKDKLLGDRDKLIDKLLPEASAYALTINNNKGIFTIQDLSNLINLKIGRNTLFKILRDLGIICKNSTVPKDRFVKAELFESKLVKTRHGHLARVTFITNKGIDYVLKKLYDEGYINVEELGLITKEVNLLKEELSENTEVLV